MCDEELTPGQYLVWLNFWKNYRSPVQTRSPVLLLLSPPMSGVIIHQLSLVTPAHKCILVATSCSVLLLYMLTRMLNSCIILLISFLWIDILRLSHLSTLSLWVNKSSSNVNTSCIYIYTVCWYIHHAKNFYNGTVGMHTVCSDDTLGCKINTLWISVHVIKLDSSIAL